MWICTIQMIFSGFHIDAFLAVTKNVEIPIAKTQNL